MKFIAIHSEILKISFLPCLFYFSLLSSFFRGYDFIPDDGKCFAETLYFRIINFLLFQQLLIHWVEAYSFYFFIMNLRLKSSVISKFEKY